MSQSSSISIKHIFENMDYGAVSEGKSLAEGWISEHASQFGSFINGKLSNTEHSEAVCTGLNSQVTLKLNKQLDSSSAISSAVSASSKWGSVSGSCRAKILYNIARQIQKHVTLIAQLESLSSGVLVRDVRENDIPSLIRSFYYFAGWAQLAESDFGNWEPLGIVADFSSLSSPLLSFAMIVAPALAAGNAVIVCPPPSKCLSALLLAQIFSTSGLSPGVLNVVPLDPACNDQSPIFAAKEVRKIAAIGSYSQVQSVLRSTCSLSPQDYTLLLNGCVPMIVLESADLDAVVDCAMDAAWNNQGCYPWSLQLMIVQEAVLEALKKKLTGRLKSLKLGGAFDKMADVSCDMPDKSFGKRLLDILERDPCVEVVQPQGSRYGEWAPTIIFSAGPPPTTVLTSAEHCPVLHCVGARSLKEAVNIANHCGGGAVASVWTENSAQAWEAASLLRVGTVWINGHGLVDSSVPLCGRKLCGRGRFNGKEGLMEYLQLSNKKELAPAHFDPAAKNMSLLPMTPALSLVNSTSIDLTYKLFYGGSHKRPDSNSSRTLLDDTGRPIAVVPEASRKDIRNAVEAAAKAQPGWWKRGAHNRAQILFNVAEKLQARHSYFSCHLMKVYQLKDNSQCSQEIDDCICRLFHFAALCDKFVHTFGNSTVNNHAITVTREPCGVVAILAGAGNALLDIVTLIGAAIAYGNTCIVVPRLDCPTPSLELALILEAAEVPAGVVNILSGETGVLLPTICGHMEIDAVWCIGHDLDILTQIKEEVFKSNLKSVWCQEHVTSPASEGNRQIYENEASRCKAVWTPITASFGS